jgi:hypothetical protein
MYGTVETHVNRKIIPYLEKRSSLPVRYLGNRLLRGSIFLKLALKFSGEGRSARMQTRVGLFAMIYLGVEISVVSEEAYRPK